jgi:anti-sigma factor RsiW
MELDEGAPEYQRLELNKHLESCEACASLMEEYKKIFDFIRLAGPEEPGDIFWAKHWKSIESALESRRRAPGPGWTPVWAAACVALVIISTFLGLENLPLSTFMDVQRARSIALELEHVYGPAPAHPESLRFDRAAGETLNVSLGLEDPYSETFWFEVEDRRPYLAM